MSTYDMEEQQVILKVMIILYQKHYQLLKELKTIPYWIKILDSEEFSHCHFLILQLIFVAQHHLRQAEPEHLPERQWAEDNAWLLQLRLQGDAHAGEPRSAAEEDHLLELHDVKDQLRLLLAQQRGDQHQHYRAQDPRAAPSAIRSAT